VWSVAAGPSVNGTLMIEINCEGFIIIFFEIISNDENSSKFSICSHLRSQNYKTILMKSPSSRAFEQHQDLAPLFSKLN
jgi:hypothetical protein